MLALFETAERCGAGEISQTEREIKQWQISHTIVKKAEWQFFAKSTTSKMSEG
jgi:hypothetical protein